MSDQPNDQKADHKPGQKTISDVRAALFKVLEGLADTDKPMDLECARAINETADTIIKSAKVEVDYLRIVNDAGNIPFLTPPGSAAQPALPKPADSPTAHDPFMASTVHKLKG